MNENQELQNFKSLALADIEKSIKAGTNILTALGLLCYTEYVGGIIRGKVDVRGESQNNFKEGLYKLGEGYRLFDSLLEKNFGMDTYVMFRCGLVHRYMTKQFTFVAKTAKNRNSLGLGFNNDGVPGMANTNYFEDLKRLISSL